MYGSCINAHTLPGGQQTDTGSGTRLSTTTASHSATGSQVKRIPSQHPEASGVCRIKSGESQFFIIRTSMNY
jgi:hypothetical protein